MSATTFLLQLIGITCVIMGLGLLLNAKHYQKMFQKLDATDPSYYLFGALPLVAGITIVLVHNLWDTPAEIVVSVIGWLALLKGVVRFVAPNWAVKFEKSIVKSPSFSFWGIEVLILGAVLTWMGFGM